MTQLLPAGGASCSQRQGISAEVIDLRSLRPLDFATMLDSIHQTHRAVMVEEAAKGTSIGGDIISELQESAFDDLQAPIAWMAGDPVPMPYNRTLEHLAIPSPEQRGGCRHELFTHTPSPGSLKC